MTEYKNMSVLVLAYLGDAVYEQYVRLFLINKNLVKVNDLQKEAIKYVSAKSQSKILEEILNDNFLNEEEMNIIKRARNNKNTRHPRNTDIITYKYATSFEALVGYLHYTNPNRLEVMLNKYVLK